MNEKNTILATPVIEGLVSLNGTNVLDIGLLTDGKVTVQFPKWTDQHINDVITLYWGLTGETLNNSQTKMVMSLTDAESMVINRKLLQPSDASYTMYYTVSDTGNISTSQSLTFHVIDSSGSVGELETYPAPTFIQAVNGVIDLDALTTDIEATCHPRMGSLGLAQAGDILRAYLGPASADKQLSFPLVANSNVFIPRSEVIHGTWGGYYEVLRGETLIGRSASTIVQCQAHDVFLAPSFPQAVSGVINIDDITYLEMDIPHYGTAAEGDIIKGYIGDHQFQPTVVQHPSDTVYRAEINKSLLTKGTYTAGYTVTYADDERVETSQTTSITISTEGSGGGGGGGVDIWNELANGRPFKLYCTELPAPASISTRDSSDNLILFAEMPSHNVNVFQAVVMDMEKKIICIRDYNTKSYTWENCYRASLSGTEHYVKSIKLNEIKSTDEICLIEEVEGGIYRFVLTDYNTYYGIPHSTPVLDLFKINTNNVYFNFKIELV